MIPDDPDTDVPSADPAADLEATLDWSGSPPTDEELEQWRPFAEFLDQALRQPIESTPLVEAGSLSESGSRSGPRTVGPFQIVRVLGKGGNGIVYLAVDPVLGRQVALKMPRDSLFLSEESRARFLQEAKIIAELRNSNIVEIHQVGSFEECPYLVFEYCPGGSLRDWMDQRAAVEKAAVEKGSGTDCAKHPQGHSGNRYLTPFQPPSPRCCAEIIRQLARAAQHAHSHGVIHRDVNPRNVLLVPLAEGEKSGAHSEFPYVAKLSDFGLGTWLDEERTAVQTQTGMVLGTLPYMAPEQTLGRGIAAPQLIDVYALGVMLYELLTGKRPFEGLSATATIGLIQGSEPASPRAGRSAIPRDLETICLKCLEKSPQRRYPSAAALAEDLDRLLSGNPIRTRRVGVIHKAIRWVAKRRIPLGIAALVACLLVTIAVGSDWYARKLTDAHGTQQQLTRVTKEQASKLIQAKASDERFQREMREKSHHLKYNQEIEAIGQLVDSQSHDSAFRLRKWIPKTAEETDLRGFEWYYLMQACGGDVAIITTLEAPGEEVQAMHVSEAGDCIFLAHDKKVTEWDVQLGRLRRVVHETSKTIRDFAVSQRLGQLAVAECGSPNIELLDLSMTPVRHQAFRKADGEGWCNRLFYLPMHQHLVSITCADQYFSPPCRVIRHFVTLQPEARTLSIRAFHVFDIVFDPVTGQLIGTDKDGIYVQYEGMDPEQTLVLPTPDRGPVTSLSITNDGLMLAASTEYRDILLCMKDSSGKWKHDATLPVTNRRNFRDANHSFSHVFNRTPLRFTRNGQRLFSTGGEELHLWDVARHKHLCAMSKLMQGEIRYLELLPEGGTAVWATHNMLGLWRPIEDVPQITGHDKETWSAGFSPDGKLLATGSDDESVRLWDLATGTLLNEFPGHVATVTKVAFSPEGTLLASGSLDGTVRVWNVASRSLTRTLKGQAGPVRSLTWFADGRRLAVTDSPDADFPNRILIWDVRTGKLLQSFNGFQDRIHQVIVTADQRRIIGASDDQTIRVWNVSDGKPVHAWTGNSPLRSATLLNQDRWLATGGNDGVIHIRDMATGSVVMELLGHTDHVLALAVSPDGRVLASGSADKTVRLWDAGTGGSLMVFNEQAARINSLAFSPNGEILATAAHDGSVKLRNGPRFKPLLSAVPK